MKPINISPSFLAKVLLHGYDYAVAEKVGLIEKDTKSMAEGRALHSFLATSFGAPADDIAISPYENYRTKEAREWRDSQPDSTIIISEAQANKYSELVKRVGNHPEVKKILDRHKTEAEKEFKKEVNGFTIKGVLDLYATGDTKVVVDWKLVGSQVFDDFPRKALYQHYDLQAAMYDYLTDATHIYFVAIENEAPHRIQVFFCTPAFLESGADKFDKAMKVLKAENWREPSFDIKGIKDLVAWGW